MGMKMGWDEAYGTAGVYVVERGDWGEWEW